VEQLFMKMVFVFGLLFFLAGTCFAQSTQDIEINQISVPTVKLTNSRLISFFMDEFFIPETLVTKMDIIDVNNNGFGEHDIVRLYPSDNVYFLEFVSDKAQSRMNQWKFKANFQITAENKDEEILNEYESNKAAYNIFGSILKGLNQNYYDLPIKIHFERDSATVLFELWGYNEMLLQEIPDHSTRLNDVILTQISTKTDTTLYDCIFIYKTITDTVYVRTNRTESEAKQDKSQ